MLRWEALKSAYVCSQNVDTQTVSKKKKKMRKKVT